MRASPPAFHRTTVNLTPAHYEWLRRLAYERRRPLAAVIRDILEQARRRDEPQEPLPLT